MDAVYINFSEAFDTVSYNIFVDKLKQWDNWVDSVVDWELAQVSVVISSAECSWRPVPRGVSWGLVLSSVVLNIFILTWMKGYIADDTKLGGATDTPEVCVAIQQELGKLKSWSERNLMMFN